MCLLQRKGKGSGKKDEKEADETEETKACSSREDTATPDLDTQEAAGSGKDAMVNGHVKKSNSEEENMSGKKLDFSLILGTGTEFAEKNSVLVV